MKEECAFLDIHVQHPWVRFEQTNILIRVA